MLRHPILSLLAILAILAGNVAICGAAGARDANARATYVRKAAASDLYEMLSARLALSHSENQAVRDFATMMLRYHQRTEGELGAAAARAGIRPVRAAMTAAQQVMMRRLLAARGADFDREYLLQQVRAHRLALLLHQDQARIGDSRSLRRLAAAAAPMVEQHFNKASALAAGL